MAEKMRVHILAKELNVSSKDIIAKCEAEGIELKNHMATLSPGLEASIREWFSEGSHVTVVEVAERVDLEKVRKRTRPRMRKEGEHETEDTLADHIGDEDFAMHDGGAAVAVAEAPAGEALGHRPEVQAAAERLGPAVLAEVTAVPESGAAGAPAAIQAVPDLTSIVTAELPPQVFEAGVPSGELAEEELAGQLPVVAAEVGSLAGEAPSPDKPSIQAAGPQNVPAPAKLSGPRVVRYEAPDVVLPPRRVPRRRDEITPEDEGAPGAAAADAGGRGRPGLRARPGEATPARPAAHHTSARRSARSASEAGEKLSEWRDKDLAEREARLRGATGRRSLARRTADKRSSRGGGHSTGPITQAQVQEPIVLKSFCSAIGVPFQQVFPILSREYNLILTITSIIPKDVAELVAAALGIELSVVAAKTGLDRLVDEYNTLERQQMQVRPPIVTILGHVDHGKTSLLDAIRRTRVAAREDGGITQHISSYHLRRGDVAVTFLDTPGHEAFTALRARGAQITDVAVLVVAADDGIMPQTIEAINHAKAAGVPVVVALNKIDLGTQNVTKIYGQLSEHGLTPSGDWGGHTDVVHTSATTGEGIDQLLEHLSALADVYEFKADPTIPASGTVVEAESRLSVGAVLHAIVRQGTLRVGDIVVCGNAFGKVRAMHDDCGHALTEAGPSIPVDIWGMNEVPMAGDAFFQVDNMQRAKEIAEEIKARRVSEARMSVSKARSLEDLVKRRSDADIPELNVIIKADVDGSVDVLKSTLGRFPDDQVKLTILHGGVGAVTDSDVQLASASDAIIVAFRVATPGTTRKLAEQEGVDIRPYKVIYEVTDEIRQALEGLLAPNEILEPRGTAEVREVFRISKVGLVAGCYVRDGVVSNQHVIRVVRNGVIVRDKCRFDSLRRFKDDVKEVRAGFECGIRLEGFDDLKTGDMIETFELVKVARTLN